MIILSGGGKGEISFDSKKKFISLLDKSKPLLYLPIAADTKKRPYSKYFSWISEEITKISDIQLKMISEDELKTMTVSDYLKFSGIFIGGGNTFKLLKLLKSTEAFVRLKKLGELNFPIYGESAGAVVLGKNISPALSTKDDHYGLVDLTALNLFPDYLIFPHHEKENNDFITKFMKKNSINKAIGIPEDSGLLFEKGNVQILGKSEITIFDIDKRPFETKSGKELTK